MSFVVLALALLALAGLTVWAGLAVRRRRTPPATAPGGSDVTDRDIVPPPHPVEPAPGSATARGEGASG